VIKGGTEIKEERYQRDFPPCPLCGEPKSPYAKTCAACAGKGRGNLLRKRLTLKICKYCGHPFRIPLWRERQNRGVFCSRECKDKFLTTLKGNKSPRWNGGTYDRRGLGWKIAREWALIRCQGKCEKCGKILTYHDYGVHHIKPYRLFKHDYEANKMSNLIVLCRSCHSQADNLGKIPNKGGEANGE